MVKKVPYVKDFHVSKLAQFRTGVKQKIPEVAFKKPQTKQKSPTQQKQNNRRTHFYPLQSSSTSPKYHLIEFTELKHFNFDF